MSKKQSQTPKEVIKGKTDDNAVRPTVSAAPPAENENGLKSVNIPVSASNALTPDGGILVPVDADSTTEVLQTDSYDPQKTKVQAVLKEDATIDDKVSKKKYDQLKSAFEEVLTNHTFDIVQSDTYRKKAGLQ